MCVKPSEQDPPQSSLGARGTLREPISEHFRATRSQTLSQLLGGIDALAADHAVGDPCDVRFGEIMSAIGRRAYAPLLLLLGAFSISPATLLPGMNWLVAAIILVLALQMMFGARQPWMPGQLLEVKFSRPSVRSACAAARPWATKIDAFAKPRLTFLVEPPFVNTAGFFCAVAALTTFPLGLVPLGPVAPGIAITLVALGLFLRDGLLLISGAAIVGGALTIAYRLFS
jgi:hypothetical protein